MKLSRGMLSIMVLLVGGLMAVNEAPEILTLTDDMANDCETIQVTRQGGRRSVVGDSTRQATPAPLLASAAGGNGRGSKPNSLSPKSSQSPCSLLLMLVTQRK